MMSKIMTINFNFQEGAYYFLAHYKTHGEYKEYYITVMDGNLEKKLYGNHVIREKDGTLLVEASANNEQDTLKTSITEALGAYLQIPIARTKILAAGTMA